MGYKRELSNDQLGALMSLLLRAADNPLEELPIPSDSLVFDFEVAPLPHATADSTPSGKDALPPCGTYPVCIRIPVSTIRAFKAKAARTGTRYQTLMIRALRAATDLPPTSGMA